MKYFNYDYKYVFPIQNIKNMKTKILFLLATLLLSCTSAYAQNNNSEPIKGDVNEDGKVDVADIVAVINIMKTSQEPSTTPPDYYVGWTNGTKSQFRGKSDADLINGATGYSIANNPTYTRAFGDNNIFYLLYQADKAPTQVILTSQGQNMTQDIVNDNSCPHDDVVIDGVTYKEFGMRFSASLGDPLDSVTVRFN